MQCNINQKGRRIRIVSGVILTLIGIAVGVLQWANVIAVDHLGWGVSLLVAVGLFQIFEGMCRWCVFRAMGFKTPL